jgi:hypothetical protein
VTLRANLKPTATLKSKPSKRCQRITLSICASIKLAKVKKILVLKVTLILHNFIVNIQIEDDDVERDKIFKFLLIFRRQRDLCWQRYFEEKMEMLTPEFYQYHVYALKVTSGSRYEQRFFVISNIFIYNVKMKSEKSRLR